ncbi:MafI family immunity protein [Bernardetia sp.]|uniref:MafI family immunity protein n=1 Tax=Bernardetia sp. TaxID=1937974 RepID=UPI0025C6251F|nr:MafI family immunity protein [Bernardetia sp.]
MVYSKENEIRKIINQAAYLGLPTQNIIDAKELVEYNESGIALELIITQVYEYEKRISKTLYEDIERLAKKIEMKEVDYSFLKELIKD